MKPSASTQLVHIEKPIYGGSFLARQDGQAIFVPMALPEEEVRIRILEDKRKRGYANAEVAEIVSASPHRIPLPVRTSAPAEDATISMRATPHSSAISRRFCAKP